MRRRTEYRATTIFLAVLVLQGTSLVNGKGKASENNDEPEKISDLTTSASSYTNHHLGGCKYAREALIHHDIRSNGLLTNILDQKINFLNNTISSLIHREIECGDAYRRACPKTRYRTIDGSCNNLGNPTWGMGNTRYGRLQPAIYGDGIHTPTKSISGSDLPLARLVSYTLHPNYDINDKKWTLAAMQWGQIITHDMSMLDGPTQSRPHVTRCCTDDGQLIGKLLLFGQCYPIIIPYNDPVYSSTNIRCLNFVRSLTDLDRGCRPRFQPAEQLNVVTHFLDLSIVYGSTDETSRLLRAGVGGRLRIDVRDNREWPPATSNRTQLCDDAEYSNICYQAGDRRANQNPQLTVLHIILLREHNRVADALVRLNPHWTDETAFQEARRIVIAEHQHISYYEWLPILLGNNYTYGNKILYSTNGYVNDYNPTVDPSVLNEHATAGFRYFHSLIAGHLHLVSENRAIDGVLRLSDYLNKPAVIERFNNMDDLVRGMSYQPQKQSDQFLDAEITHYLFRDTKQFGSDLRARDIQRNRDHGLASYNDMRQYCGLPRAKYFSDFADHIPPEIVQQISELYVSPDDVDLTVGTALETDVEGTLVGPTLMCILVKQFQNTRVGDRFWYESGDHPAAFTIEQLNEIRKASIARLFCDNGDYITHMQPRAFEQVSETNPIVNCEYIPKIDLSLWKDYAPELERGKYNL